MKQFSCGDIVPGCKAIFRAEQEQAVLSLVAEHAEVEHGLLQVPAAMVDQVRSLMLDLPAVLA